MKNTYNNLKINIEKRGDSLCPNCEDIFLIDNDVDDNVNNDESSLFSIKQNSKNDKVNESINIDNDSLLFHTKERNN